MAQDTTNERIAMSRKHYVAVAAIIRERIESTKDSSAPLHAAYRIACRDLAVDLASMFAQENPRFDRTKFMDAAGCL